MIKEQSIEGEVKFRALANLPIPRRISTLF